MCNKKRTVITVVAILFAIDGLAYAQNHGTRAEAKAMLDTAIAFYKANGPEKAFAAFNNPKGQFVDKDLYIFAVDLNGKILAHGAKAGLLGRGMEEIRDPDEKYFLWEMMTIAKVNGAGTVEYKWENPQSLVVEMKTIIFEKNRRNGAWLRVL